ncbi:hypothetical protein SAMN05216298_4550 [Glycomyces sambucus]|uniref:Uncharacterized protein n=1 Tax=Glycomyces sambucus TaxID=380244 RepID=A0A1G9LJI5_9ACTN|nr:hypothetical protein [Glycomyces sambucus]SDL62003.1 hypothetical protein SAMN05216298_4550 [Glycomyces sambucus]
MRRHPLHRHLATAAAIAATAAALAACGSGDPTETAASATAEPTASASATAEPTATASATEPGADPRLEVLVGTWEADEEEVGPHGSTLAVAEDGTAELASFANQHGSYAGAIVLGDADPHRFEGTEPETGEAIVLELAYDAGADTLAVTYPDGATYVHTRA